MTHEEATNIIGATPDPRICKYFDSGKYTHLFNPNGYCDFCGRSAIEIKRYTKLYEEAESRMFSI